MLSIIPLQEDLRPPRPAPEAVVSAMLEHVERRARDLKAAEEARDEYRRDSEIDGKQCLELRDRVRELERRIVVLDDDRQSLRELLARAGAEGAKLEAYWNSLDKHRKALEALHKRLRIKRPPVLPPLPKSFDVDRPIPF